MLRNIFTLIFINCHIKNKVGNENLKNSLSLKGYQKGELVKNKISSSKCLFLIRMNKKRPQGEEGRPHSHIHNIHTFTASHIHPFTPPPLRPSISSIVVKLQESIKSIKKY